MPRKKPGNAMKNSEDQLRPQFHPTAEKCHTSNPTEDKSVIVIIHFDPGDFPIAGYFSPVPTFQAAKRCQRPLWR